jgi:hypothetical protein
LRYWVPTSTGFGPDQPLTTETYGWGAGSAGGLWNSTGGSCRAVHQFQTDATMHETGYGYLYPVHLNNSNSTGMVNGIYGISATPNLKKAWFSICWSTGTDWSWWGQPSGPSQITDDQTWEMVHELVPQASEQYIPTDNVWGGHSGTMPNVTVPANYFDRVVCRSTVGNIDSIDYLAWGNPDYNEARNAGDSGYESCACPNNYPNAPDNNLGTLGMWMIDAPGTVDDQFMFHDVEDDPLLASFLADMADGRQYSWFVFKPYDYLGVDLWGVSTGGLPWPKTTPWYIKADHYYGSGLLGWMFLQVGNPVSAEDWVLYK